MPSKAMKLPVLPLTQAVMLPRMSATIPTDSSDARGAVEAALAQEGLLLLLPKVESRYATVGVVAKIEEKGNLPDGTEVVAVQGRSRAVLGEVTAEAGLLRAEVTLSPDPSAFSERSRPLVQGGAGRADPQGAAAQRRLGADGQEPARVHPPPADGGHQEAAGRGRRRRGRRVPVPGRGRGHARGRPQGVRSRAGPPGADER